jgi:hypothetical protein
LLADAELNDSRFVAGVTGIFDFYAENAEIEDWVPAQDEQPNPLTPFPVKEGGTESRGPPLHPSQDAGSVVTGEEEPNDPHFLTREGVRG